MSNLVTEREITDKKDPKRELNKITIREPKKRNRTRKKNNRTLERRMMEKESAENTPNLLKERNLKIFERAIGQEDHKYR